VISGPLSARLCPPPGFATGCRSFHVNHALFIELYLTLQTDFAARCCFWFSPNDYPIEQICPPLLLRSFVSRVKKRALNKKNTSVIAYRNAGKCPTPKILGPPKLGVLVLRHFSLMVNLRLVWLISVFS